MKKFRFGLESVLDYRRQVLDGRQGEYARALDRVHQQEAKVAQAQARYRELNRKFREEAAAGITILDAMTYEEGLRLLEREIARETQRLEACRRTAEEKRQQMIEAHKDKTVLERLREKKLEDYSKEAQKSEERFIDELVCAGHGEAGQGA